MNVAAVEMERSIPIEHIQEVKKKQNIFAWWVWEVR